MPTVVHPQTTYFYKVGRIAPQNQELCLAR
jgi:hypothetical protein